MYIYPPILLQLIARLKLSRGRFVVFFFFLVVFDQVHLFLVLFAFFGLKIMYVRVYLILVLYWFRKSA